jgi:hypothetical protein
VWLCEQTELPLLGTRKFTGVPSASSPQRYKLTVWCGIASFVILGPYNFQDKEDAAVTVTSDRFAENVTQLL